MSPSQERLEILEMIQNGMITPDEGLKLIEALGESQAAENEEYINAKELMEDSSSGEEVTYTPVPDLDQEFENWKSWWLVPFWIGVAITVLGGVWIYQAWVNRGISFAFFAAWIPFLIGIGTLVLGWNSRTGPWLHLRVQQAPGEKPERIAFSFPLPVHFLAWILRTVGSFIRNADLAGADQIILALGSYSQGDPPLSIDVDDGDNGEKVKIFIG